MKYTFILMLVAAYCGVGTSRRRADPCNIAMTLNATMRGHQNYVEDLEREGFLCDRLLRAKWYRFKRWDAESRQLKDAKMHDQCTSDYTCGTHSPIYLMGQYAGHPEVEEGEVERLVCSSLNGNCCVQRWSIKVKNCGSFMTYRLPDVPGCFMAYCAN